MCRLLADALPFCTGHLSIPGFWHSRGAVGRGWSQFPADTRKDGEAWCSPQGADCGSVPPECELAFTECLEAMGLHLLSASRPRVCPRALAVLTVQLSLNE